MTQFRNCVSFFEKKLLKVFPWLRPSDGLQRRRIFYDVNGKFRWAMLSECKLQGYQVYKDRESGSMSPLGLLLRDNFGKKLNLFPPVGLPARKFFIPVVDHFGCGKFFWQLWLKISTAEFHFLCQYVAATWYKKFC